MSDKEPDPIPVFVTSLVSGRTLGPQVVIEIGSAKTQVNAEKAREIALMILEASEAATSDAFLVRFLCEKTKTTPDAAIGIILGEFREFRDEQIKKRDL